MTRLITERLTLDDVGPGDAAFVLELLNDPGWVRNIGSGGWTSTARREAPGLR